MTRLDRKTLSKAQPRDLRRLAKAIGVDAPCDCDACRPQLVEHVVRKLDLIIPAIHAVTPKRGVPR